MRLNLHPDTRTPDHLKITRLMAIFNNDLQKKLFVRTIYF